MRKDVSLSLMILSFSLGAAPNATAQQYMATDLGTLNGDAVSYGTGINASGQVTGFSDEIIGSSPDGSTVIQRAFVTDAATNALTSLGTLGGTDSAGSGINASGQVTGTANIAQNQNHAFITNAATNAMIDLGTLGGTNSGASAINDSGEVTGYSQTSGNAANHAFLYTNGHMLDLNALLSTTQASLYTITSGEGINDSGQIVADGIVNATDQEVAFLLTPIAPVPLPATAWLMLSGLVGLGTTVRQRTASR